MDHKHKEKIVYVSSSQKKRLFQLIAKNPQLISGKLRNGFTMLDCQRLWQRITNECNALPGATKNWKQWRKTWQDLRSKYKKQDYLSLRDVASLTLTPAEREVLGLKIGPRERVAPQLLEGESSPPQGNESPQEQTEFIQLDEDLLQDHSYSVDLNYVETLSEPESTSDANVISKNTSKTKDNDPKSFNSKHSDCDFNCDVLTTLEQKKLQVKEDYLNFKKDYLKQKLKLFKEQTEALKSIAQELAK